MSLVSRSHYGMVIELQKQLEAALGICVDYHNTLCRASVPDPVAGRKEVQELFNRFGLEVEPRSLYGEAPQGRVYERDRRA